MVLPEAGPHDPGGPYNGYALRDRVFLDDAPGPDAGDGPPPADAKPLLAASLSPQKAQALERAFVSLIEADTLADAKHPAFRLERPIRVTPEFGPAVAAEFRRIVRTGTMSASRQLVRPAHEVAVGIWLATLSRA